jgi:outer membrane lipoprotein-sorting protein
MMHDRDRDRSAWEAAVGRLVVNTREWLGVFKGFFIVHRASCIVHLLAVALCFFAVEAYASPFDGIKKTYSEITTLEAAFHQKIFIAGLKKEREFAGEFFYKRQKGFLWRYKTPKVKYFLYDGRYVYQGEDEKPFIIKERINQEKTGGTFLDLIEDISKMDELFTLKQQSMAGSLEVLDLLPKKDGTVTAAKVWIDSESRVRKMEIHEFTGNVNTIEFSGVRTNQPLDDRKFIFKPDKQKEIVER